MKHRFIPFLLFFILTSLQGIGQSVSLKLGNNQISLNQPFQITIVVKNDQLRSYGKFPEIPGFVKSRTSSSSSYSMINGQVSQSYELTQDYYPKQKGSYTLPAFELEVNGQTLRSPGTTITVSEAKQRPRQRRRSFFDPFDPFGYQSQPQEYVDVKSDAFFSISANKKNIYVGEGVNVTIAFYTEYPTKARYETYKLNEQLQEIIKEIKPENCWEETFDVGSSEGVPVQINGKNFLQHKFYQATWYPLNNETLKIPSFPFSIIKYKQAKNPSFFGQNLKEDIKTFRSKAVTIQVKDLPPHPLKEQVSVGDYRLNEKINRKNLKTGESLEYSFSITGKGNISGIEQPKLPEIEGIELYPPNVWQNINKNGNSVLGTKTFSYYGMAEEPGIYKLGDFFQWIYFNPREEKYDTLRSRIVLRVSGESMKNQTIQSNDLGDFYAQIETADNHLKELKPTPWLRWILTVFSLASIGLIIYQLSRKTK